MLDIEKQITYWRNGSGEDWQVARELVESGRIRHGLFFAHLALEKILKAHVCRHTNDLAPKIHSLLRLAELTGLTLSDMQRMRLARFDRYQLEGRYPVASMSLLEADQAQKELEEIEKVLRWLISQF